MDAGKRGDNALEVGGVKKGVGSGFGSLGRGLLGDCSV